MKKITVGQVKLIQTGLIVLAVVVVGFKLKKSVSAMAENAEQVIGTAKKVVTEDINPVSDKNFINKSFNSTMAAVTGNDYEGFSFGIWLADKLHPVPEF